VGGWNKSPPSPAHTIEIRLYIRAVKAAAGGVGLAAGATFSFALRSNRFRSLTMPEPESRISSNRRVPVIQ
jgi:hypothetical protein